jgi:hypothetical protein
MLKDANDWAGSVLASIRDGILAADNLILLGALVVCGLSMLVVFVLGLVMNFSQKPQQIPPAAWPVRKDSK